MVRKKLLILLRMVLWRQRWLSKDVARVQKLPLSESDRLCKLVPDKILTRNLICRMPLLRFPNCKQRKRHLILYCGIRSSMPKCLKATCVVQVYMLAVRLFAVMILLTGVPVSTADDKETGEKMLVTQYEGSVMKILG